MCSNGVTLSIRGVFVVMDLCGWGPQTACRHDVYSLFRYFPYIRDAGYGEEFKDVGDG